MFCSNCGTQLPDEAAFCSNCGAPTSGTASASGSSTQTERTLYEVALPKGAMFFQGPGVQPLAFGNSHITITDRRLIIEDTGGRTHQVLLADITNVSRRIRWIAHDVGIAFTNPTLALTLYCKTKQDVHELATMIDEARTMS
jgi:zinc-ribbon domain